MGPVTYTWRTFGTALSLFDKMVVEREAWRHRRSEPGQWDGMGRIAKATRAAYT